MNRKDTPVELCRNNVVYRMLTTVRFLNDTFNQKDQIAPFDDAEQVVSTDVGASTKSACFKQFGVDDHPSRLTVKKLDAVPILIDE